MKVRIRPYHDLFCAEEKWLCFWLYIPGTMAATPEAALHKARELLKMRDRCGTHSL
jgi:hypothetical protein